MKADPRLRAMIILSLSLTAALTTIQAFSDKSEMKPKVPSSSNVSAGYDSDRSADDARLDVEIVNLLGTGFEPAELTRPAGRFLLGVNNRSELSNPLFQLVRDDGVIVGEQRMRGKTWRKVVDPRPGRYTIRVEGHAQWQCVITIVSG